MIWGLMLVCAPALISIRLAIKRRERPEFVAILALLVNMPGAMLLFLGLLMLADGGGGLHF